ncbi:MAG: hypothetical protein J0M35_13665 [Candidatus Obscuribacter phosphatis]|uniref:Uncharacterized protein n=1 Tax=Candidatus Obscuribacter phosphatis TaxID=1906157 RepID=A0A8J7TNW5_9BACT|nr:hypothetical protein [Candidatus Obscuribacter phosphatis]
MTDFLPDLEPVTKEFTFVRATPADVKAPSLITSAGWIGLELKNIGVRAIQMQR